MRCHFQVTGCLSRLWVCWFFTSSFSPFTQNPAQHQMCFLAQEDPVNLQGPSRPEVHSKEPELCCVHTSHDIQPWLTLSVPLPPRTSCSSLQCCPQIPLKLVLVKPHRGEQQAEVLALQRHRAERQNHPAPARKATFVPHIT